jgi:hypothetical protein
MINSRRKGNNAEREVCKILSKHFPGKFERRSMGIAGSDIVCPDDFPYAVEVKHDKRISAIHLFKGHNVLRKWWEQACKQTPEGKRPILLAKVEGCWFVYYGMEWHLLQLWLEAEVRK